ncbi:MAG: hypothetical protein ACU0A5_01655, partial [Salipiger marinus]|uniref:hypothetical protein n=1 Tax=Salipiger marinus TaxID=555512 RepID=UPI004059C7F4
ARCPSCPRIPFRLVCDQLRVSASPPPRLASRQHLSAAGEGLSTEYNKHPQPLFSQKLHVQHQKPQKSRKSKSLIPKIPAQHTQITPKIDIPT